MNKNLRSSFQRFLATGAYCTPPGRAACALSNARTLLEWQAAERAGLVRIRAEAEQESFADVYGKEIYEREKDAIERLGCWFVIAEFNAGDQAVGDQWEHAGSIGMCVYQNPTDPFENAYVPDLMRAALNLVPQPGEV